MIQQKVELVLPVTSNKLSAMTRFIFILCIFFSSINLSAQSKLKKTVFIIADGIPADLIERYDLLNFKKIAKEKIL